MNKYLEHEESKARVTKEFISEKYRTPLKNRHRVIDGSEKFEIPREDFLYYLSKIFSVRSFASIVGVLIILFHENIFDQLKTVVKKKFKNKR